MITYTVSSSQLAERDVYAIAPVSSLAEFLKPRQSLCIVKTPFVGRIVEMCRIEGRNRSGGRASLHLGACSENDQGRLKSRLDKSLHSPFLFIAWKAKGYHTFRLVEERKTVAEYPDLPSALDAYFPDGFVPEASFRRKLPIFALACLAAARRRRFKDISSVLCARMRALASAAPPGSGSDRPEARADSGATNLL